MNNEPPDFFLGSSEHRGEWATARSCWIKKHLFMDDGTECVFIEIQPEVIGQQYGLGGKDIHNVILAPRHKKSTFSNTLERPERVHIYRVLNEKATISDRINNSDVELTAWGEIYPTLEEAKHAATS